MPLNVAVDIDEPTNSQVLPADSTIRFEGTYSWSTTGISPWVPGMRGLEWRIRSLESGLYYSPDLNSFTVDDVWHHAGCFRDPTATDPDVNWNSGSLPPLPATGRWTTSLPGDLGQLNLSDFSAGLYELEVEFRLKRALSPTRVADARAVFQIDTADPALSIDEPGHRGTVDPGPLTFRGSVSDPEGNIESISVRVIDEEAGLSWQPGFGFRPGVHSWNGVVNGATWAAQWNGSAHGSGIYLLRAIATDEAGNSVEQTARFYVDHGSPEVEVLSPTDSALEPLGVVTIEGTIRNRNAGWTYPQLTIEDLNTGSFWNGDYGIWGERNRPSGVALGSPNGDGLRTWSFDFDAGLALNTPGGGSGEYRATLQVAQPSVYGNQPGTASVDFSIDFEDEEEPETQILEPQDFQQFPPGPIQFRGAASDNVRADGVFVVLRRETGDPADPYEYWVPVLGNFQPGYYQFTVPVDPDGDWSFDWDSVGFPGTIFFQARAFDAAGNNDATPAFVTITAN